MKGNPEPVKKLFSHRDDVTLANPYGSPARGWDEVAKTVEHVASLRRDGKFLGTEELARYVIAGLAYVVGKVRTEAKVGGKEDITPTALSRCRD